MGRDRRTLIFGLLGALALAGCGSSSSPPAGATGSTGTTATTGSPGAALAGCLVTQKAANHGSVSQISPAVPGEGPGAPKPGVALGFETGGPSNVNGTIAEANLNSLSVYVFADPATARRVAFRAGPAVARTARQDAAKARKTGNPDAQPAFTSATIIGRAILVYVSGTTFGRGNPILPAEVGAVRSCLKSAGLT